MNSSEKAELLKSTIFQLYSKEGRSKVYISKLLKINRKTLGLKIKEWDFPKPEPQRHLTPSNQKFANRNRTYIKSRLDRDISISQIARELKVSRYYLQETIIPNDSVLNKSRNDYINRIHESARIRKEKAMTDSSLTYDFNSISGEMWKPILGYEGYEISNMGRIKHYMTSYNSYHEVKSCPNKNNGRLYVMLHHNGERKNLQVARLVAHAFVPGYKDGLTVNHKDGDVSNCCASNLEWLSQSQNNEHSYRVLNRRKNSGKRYEFKKILYQDKYEFKTIAAFARFIQKSETQARRYIDNPSKHNIKLIK